MNTNSASILYVLLLEEDYAVTSHGSDPCDAVRQHFDELDMYGSPPSDYSAEEATVVVFSIPQAIEDELFDEFEDMESDERAEAILRIAAKHPEITRTEVKFAYESGDLRVSKSVP